MSFSDFKFYMNIEVVHFFPDAWQLLTLYGQVGVGGDADHIFVVKIDAPTELCVIIGQADPKMADVVLGKIKEVA